MNKVLRFTMLSLLAIVSAVSFAQTEIDFTKQTITATGNGFTLTASGFTFAADKAEGATAPTQNPNSKDLRIYAKNTFKVNGTSFTKLVFTMSKQGKSRWADVTASTGTVTLDTEAGTTTWTNTTGVAEVTFTVGDKAVHGTDVTKSGQFDLDKVVITGEGGETPVTVTKPTISGTTPFTESTTVTITAGEGTSIFYTTDADQTPDDRSTEYTGPFTIAETTTVKAIAYDADFNASDVATATFVKQDPNASVSLPYSALSDGQGDFTIDNVTIPDGLNYVWQWRDKSGTTPAHMHASAYVNRKNLASESWLESPFIDLTNATKPTLTFSHTGKFFGTPSDEATLWVIDKATNEKTQVTIPNYFTGKDWTFVDNSIDLSAFAGKTVKIAFKYVSTESAAGTWEINNFSLKDEGGSTPTGDKGTTIDNPYTPAEANAAASVLASGAKSDASYYVKGIVSSITQVNTDQYGNARFYISADGTTTADQFYCFDCFNLDGAKFTDANQIAVGDAVIVYGQLQNFNGTYELARGGKIVKTNHKDKPVETKTAADIAAFNALAVNTPAVLTLTNAEVLYSWTSNNGNNSTYIRDASGALCLRNAGLDLTANQVLNGTVNLTREDYYGLVQGGKNDNTSNTTFTATAGDPIQAKDINVADAQNYVSDLVQLKNVNIVSKTSGERTNYYAVVGNDSLQVYNGFHIDGYTVAEAQNVNIKGIITKYNTTYEIQPVEAPTAATPDAINEIKADAAIDVNAPMYNLAGQRVAKSYKGVVIQNGHKFLLSK